MGLIPGWGAKILHVTWHGMAKMKKIFKVELSLGIPTEGTVDVVGILRLVHVVNGIPILDNFEISGKYRHMQIEEGHFMGGLWYGDTGVQGWLESRIYE